MPRVAPARAADWSRRRRASPLLKIAGVGDRGRRARADLQHQPRSAHPDQGRAVGRADRARRARRVDVPARPHEVRPLRLRHRRQRRSGAPRRYQPRARSARCASCWRRSLPASPGIVYASRLRSVSTALDGGTLVLYAVAAAVIGGTSLFGGRGKAIHARARRPRDRGDRQRHGPAGLQRGSQVRRHRARAARRGHDRRGRPAQRVSLTGRARYSAIGVGIAPCAAAMIRSLVQIVAAAETIRLKIPLMSLLVCARPRRVDSASGNGEPDGGLRGVSPGESARGSLRTGFAHDRRARRGGDAIAGQRVVEGAAGIPRLVVGRADRRHRHRGRSSRTRADRALAVDRDHARNWVCDRSRSFSGRSRSRGS